MREFDVAVVGAGVIGCFVARNLRRYSLSVALIEKNSDVCMGISKANTAVVYAGYDNAPGSLKAKLCVRGNIRFSELCADLDVPFSRCGSLMISRSEGGDDALERKLRHGLENGVSGLRIVGPDEARSIEPELGPGVRTALYAPGTGTVNPWELGIAAYENAVSNGVRFFPGTEAEEFEDGVLKAGSFSIGAKILVDCSGINSGRIARSRYRVMPDAADYVVIDKNSRHMPRTVIFEQSGENCRGITAVPTVDGSLLLGPSHRPARAENGTDGSEITKILDTSAAVFPRLELNVIRCFSGLRPNPAGTDGEDIHDFAIDVGGNVISLVGIKTPGLTCADGLGGYVAGLCAEMLGAEPNPAFNPKRKAIVKVHGLSFEERNRLIRSNPDYGEIVCQCCDISLGEIIEAIGRGAVTSEMIKHRCGTSMGRCQGARCLQKIRAILEESQC